MTNQKLPGIKCYISKLGEAWPVKEADGEVEAYALTPAQLADYAKQQRAIGFNAGKSSNCVKMNRHGDLIDEETYPTLADFEASLAEGEK